MSHNTIPLLGCGILQKEVDYLIKKNSWDISSKYFCSSLHIDFSKLESALVGALKGSEDKHNMVLYGTCHPFMDQFMEEHQSVRVKGQNCVEQLLGWDLFNEYLMEGAFFLMEDWAKRWEFVMNKAFGDNPEVIREILSSEHKYLLALRTQCSGDYLKEAQRVSLKAGLPLKWIDVDLTHLEKVLLRGMKEWKNLYG